MFCLYSLDIRRGENNRFHTHIHICHSCLRVVLCFVLFRFVFNRFAPSLVLCFCSLSHSRVFAFKRFNNSTKGDFQKYLCRKIELVVLCVLFCVYISLSLFAWIILLQFCFCLSFCLSVLFFNALYSLALFSSFVCFACYFLHSRSSVLRAFSSSVFCRHFLSIPDQRVF